MQNVTTGTFNFRLYFYNGSTFGQTTAGIAVNTPNPGSTGIDIDGTIKQIACAGTPVPGLAATTTPTVCPLNPGQLNIAQSLGTGISYQWQASTNNGATWSNTGTNSYLLTYPGMTVNTDFRCIVTCANGGASATSNTVKITVTNPPPTPGPISGIAALCGGTNGNAFSIATVAGANSYTWSYSGSGATITGQGTNNITINFLPTATSGNLQVISANACGNNGTPSILPITINQPPAIPAGFSGTLTPCRGSAGNSYSVNPVAGVSFSWSYSGTGITINSGNTENPTIDFSAGATNGTLSVTATDANGCASSVLTKTITLAAIPAQPSVITGNTTVCAGTNQTYSVTNIAGITYTWTVPADWTIISGQGNNSISVKAGSTTGIQTLQVVPSNACGNGTGRSLNVTVNNVPAVPGTISGSSTVCANTAGNPYSITSVPNATSYTWTYSGVGATITGGTAVNPTISFALNATSGDLKVIANNSCGSSIASTYSITINPKPATTGLPSSQSVCAGADIVDILLSNSNGVSGTTYSWTRTTPAGIGGTVPASGSGLPDGAAISGFFTNSNTIPVTVTFTINSMSADGCSGTTATATVVINPTTAITDQPADVTICESANTSFAVTASGGGLAYQWKVSTDGGVTWNNVTNGPIYSGANASILNLTKPIAGMDGYQYQCVISGGSCGIVTTDAATITINPMPATTALPLSQTSCSGVAIADIVLSNSNSIAGTTYTWTRTSPAGITGSVPTGGTNVADGTSITGILTSTNTTATSVDFTVNSVSAAGCAGTTATAKVIVNPATVITAQPAAVTICQGANASFSVTATGLSLNYQWLVSTDGGISWTPVSNGGGYGGASTATLTITNPAGTFSGNQYKCTVTSSCGPVDTNGSATLIINQAPVTTALPGSQTICSGTAISNIVLSNSNGIAGARYSWTRTTPAGIGGTVATSGSNLADGSVVSGTLTNSTTNPINVVFTINAIGPAPTNCAAASITVSVTVNPTTVITGQPVSPTAFCAGLNTSFTVTATGSNLSYKWQESTDGGLSWNPVTDGGVYSTSTTNRLNLTNVPAGMNGYRYMAVVTGDCGVLTTNGNAALTVNSAPSAPVITSQSGDFNICAPGSDRYTATSTGLPTPNYTWSYTGGTGVTFNTTTSNPTTATFSTTATSGEF